jgi:hypothetical protein
MVEFSTIETLSNSSIACIHFSAHQLLKLLIDLNRALITEPAARLNIVRQREEMREQCNIFRSTIMDGMHH